MTARTSGRLSRLAQRAGAAVDLGMGARVGRVVDLGQVLKIQAGVDLRGADAGVAQELLHGAQVATGLQHMAGKGVAQHVRMDRCAQTREL